MRRRNPASRAKAPINSGAGSGTTGVLDRQALELPAMSVTKGTDREDIRRETVHDFVGVIALDPDLGPIGVADTDRALAALMTILMFSGLQSLV